MLRLELRELILWLPRIIILCPEFGYSNVFMNEFIPKFKIWLGLFSDIDYLLTRVARNGDTANKIGTYSLAVLAKHHG
jgi:methylthioribose-1-phosphate isomerase